MKECLDNEVDKDETVSPYTSTGVRNYGMGNT